tara:strand:- start:6384 stop:6578 length:195 start_codon:yes stop_codon:yes gene_type:complete
MVPHNQSEMKEKTTIRTGWCLFQETSSDRINIALIMPDPCCIESVNTRPGEIIYSPRSFSSPIQ